MKQVLTIAATLFFLTVFAQQKPNTLSAKEKKDGWQLLFDGKTTKGWHTFNKPQIGEAWKVANGAIYLDTTQKDGWQVKGGGDIVNEKVLANFHLKLEWKISKAGNSGIMFYVQEGEKFDYPWYSGPEVQVLDNDGHDDGKITKHRAGDLYDLIKSTTEPVKPYNQWNKAEIICNNGKLTLKLNGVTVVSTIMWDDNWKALIAGSKFKDMPGFGTFTSGKISLQDHGHAVWFRNIKVKEL
jgi:uncharacterized protein YaiE (UPF0345 family)